VVRTPEMPAPCNTSSAAFKDRAPKAEDGQSSLCKLPLVSDSTTEPLIQNMCRQATGGDQIGSAHTR
jgi:hypothetical protein